MRKNGDKKIEITTSSGIDIFYYFYTYAYRPQRQRLIRTEVVMKKLSKILRLVCIGFVLLSTFCLYPQDKAAAAASAETMETKIDKIFETMNKPSSPGAAVAVVKDGLVIFRKGYGCAQVEYNIPITPSTIFHVASVSKQFTAMAITMLEAQGKLSADDDIRKYLPTMPDFGKKVTILHLLHHTSGIRDIFDLFVLSGGRMDDVLTRQQMLELIERQKDLNFPPGDRFMYSNSGYTLLAEIVSKVGGKPFADWVKENIFDPLGMSSSHFHDDHEMVVKNRAYSYKITGEKELKKKVLNYDHVGATSLFTTVEDMTNWMRNFSEKRVGGEEAIQKMLTKGILDNGKEIEYARGVRVGSWRGLETIAHSGYDAGFCSRMVYFPGEKLGVVVLCNLESARPTLYAQQVAELYLTGKLKPDENAAAAKPGKKIKLKKKQLQSCTGTFFLEKSRTLRRFAIEKNTLYIIRSDNNRSILVPTSATSFYMKKYPRVKVRFSELAGNTYSRMVVFVPGEIELPAHRVEPFEPTEAELDEFAGAYYSGELDVTWRFSIRDGKLFLKKPRNPEREISPTITNSFTFGFSISFKWDSRGKVAGFTVNSGRIIDLKFKKVN